MFSRAAAGSTLREYHWRVLAASWPATRSTSLPNEEEPTAPRVAAAASDFFEYALLIFSGIGTPLCFSFVGFRMFRSIAWEIVGMRPRHFF